MGKLCDFCRVTSKHTINNLRYSTDSWEINLHVGLVSNYDQHVCMKFDVACNKIKQVSSLPRDHSSGLYPNIPAATNWRIGNWTKSVALTPYKIYSLPGFVSESSALFFTSDKFLARISGILKDVPHSISHIYIVFHIDTLKHIEPSRLFSSFEQIIWVCTKRDIIK